MKKYVLPILAMTFACACQQQKNIDTNEAIITDSTEIIDTNTPMSSIMEISNIIPLETSELSLLGEIEKIIKRNGVIYVKSRNRALTIFDEKGKFLHTIGAIGAGPEEYPMLADFDINKEKVYILTVNKIQVYNRNGEWLNSIPLNLNASGIRLTNDKILLFVLGDEHVVHLLDENGQKIESVLKRNQALRLSRSISFIKYDDCLLFPMGRSNDILAYDISKGGTFRQMSYLSSAQLSNEQEATLMESSQDYRKELNNRGCFEGLLADNTHAIVPFIKNGDVTFRNKSI